MTAVWRVLQGIQHGIDQQAHNSRLQCDACKGRKDVKAEGTCSAGSLLCSCFVRPPCTNQNSVIPCLILQEIFPLELWAYRLQCSAVYFFYSIAPITVSSQAIALSHTVVLRVLRNRGMLPVN